MTNPRSIDVREDFVGDELLVPLPVLSIPTTRGGKSVPCGVGGQRVRDALFFTSLIIPHLPMDKEDEEVDGVEVGNGGGEAGRETPCESHNEVAPTMPMSLAIDTLEESWKHIQKTQSLQIQSCQDTISRSLKMQHPSLQNRSPPLAPLPRLGLEARLETPLLH